MEWFTSDADDNLVRAIAEKVISLAERDAVQIDQDLLLEIADHGWTDLTKTVAPCILPAKCSWGLVKGLLERNCADAAWSAARRMVEAGGSAADVPMWLQGALSIWEVKHASGLGEPMNNVRLVEQWSDDHAAALIDLYAANADSMSKSFSPSAWQSFRSQLHDMYETWRNRLYSRLDRIAEHESRSATRYGGSLGCASAAIIFVLAVIVENVVGKSSAFTVFAIVATIVLPFVIVIYTNKSNRDRKLAQASERLRHRQQSLEAALGMRSPIVESGEADI